MSWWEKGWLDKRKKQAVSRLLLEIGSRIG
jgi:hypothetical protein